MFKLKSTHPLSIIIIISYYCFCLPVAFVIVVGKRFFFGIKRVFSSIKNYLFPKE